MQAATAVSVKPKVSQYGQHIPRPSGKNVNAGSGPSHFGANLIIKTAQANAHEAQKLAQYFSRKANGNLQQILEQIHLFLYTQFNKIEEGKNHNLQTLSRAWHNYRHEGINCEDATLITLQILNALGIKAFARRIEQQSAPGVASHIYTIVPKNQNQPATTKNGTFQGQYFTVDGLLPHFNQEAPHLMAIDSKNEPRVNYRVMNAPNSQCANAKVKPHPQNPNMLIVVMRPSGQQVAVPNNSQNRARLKSLNCTCAKRGMNDPTMLLLSALLTDQTSGSGNGQGEGEGEQGNGGSSSGGGGNFNPIQWAMQALMSSGFGFHNEEARVKQRVEEMIKKNVLSLYSTQGGVRKGAGYISQFTPDQLREFLTRLDEFIALQKQQKEAITECENGSAWKQGTGTCGMWRIHRREISAAEVLKTMTRERLNQLNGNPTPGSNNNWDNLPSTNAGFGEGLKKIAPYAILTAAGYAAYQAWGQSKPKKPVKK